MQIVVKFASNVDIDIHVHTLTISASELSYT